MKKFVPALFAASMAFSLSGQADERHHRYAAVVKPAASAAASESPVKEMQTNLRRMIVQLDRVAAAGTEEERQKATIDYMQIAQENMMLGHALYADGEACSMMGQGMMQGSMMHGGMMGKGMMHGDMMNPRQGGKPATQADRMQQMEQRMDRMQQMMEHMMRRSGDAPMPMQKQMPMR